MKQTKEELLKELSTIEDKERELKSENEKIKNYEKFKERKPDLIVGKAHCDIGITNIDYSWYEDRFFKIGDAISIHGNCGTSYNANAPITSATHTYFHNVWTEQQRRRFQKKLDSVAIKEIIKIMSDLHFVLEIMGLQSDSFYLSNLYPKDKVEEIKNEMEKERKKILNKYTDKQIKDVLKSRLSHGQSILENYLKKNRPNLLKLAEKIKVKINNLNL